MNEIKYFSMFTGVGGFELGFERANDKENSVWETPAGLPISNYRNSSNDTTNNTWSNGSFLKNNTKFTCVGCSEIDKYSSQVLERRFPKIKNWGDCTKIKPEDLPDFDMLCGGFPCQAFSIAGKRRGFEDTRGTMFFEVARILEVKRPKIVLLENVKGLLNHEKGKTFSVILQTLDELGYDVQWMVLNSKFFGVPQNRERVLIIGSLRGTSRPEILPFRESGKGDVGKDCSATITSSYRKGCNNHNQLLKFNNPIHSNNRIYGEEGISPALNTAQGGNRQPKIRAVLTPDRPEKRQNGRRFKEEGEPIFTLTGQDIHGVATNKMEWFGRDIKTGEKGINPLQEAHRVYDTNGIMQTVKPTPLKIKEEMQIRRLTPTECCRLQGFPDDWNEWGTDEQGNKVKMSDTQRYKQMGNAVTTNVIAAIGMQILKSAQNHGNKSEEKDE